MSFAESGKGKTNGEIAEMLDVNKRHVRLVKKQYTEGGLAALKTQKRGRRNGEKEEHSRQRFDAVKVLRSACGQEKHL